MTTAEEIKKMLLDTLSCMDSASGMLFILALKHGVDEVYEEFNEAIKDEADDNLAVSSMVRLSRYTPGLENAADISLEQGERVTWESRSGDRVEIIIDSDLMENSGYLGYEAIFTDTNERAFAIAEQIVDWEGKC